MEPCVSLWPNGEFTLGYAPCGGMERELTPSEYALRWDTPLGLAMGANSHTAEKDSRVQRGKNGMTSYSKRLLRNSVEMLERCYGTTNLSFVTLTIPDITNQELVNVNKNWHHIVRVYYQRLGRILSRACLPHYYAGCTEIQPERSREQRRPVLHLHHIVVGRRRGRKSWGLRPSVFREVWADSVKRYLWNEYDWSACERVEGVTRSAAAYLSKYFTKSGGDSPHQAIDFTGYPLPSAWSNVAAGLRSSVKKRIRKAPDLAEMMEGMCRSGMMEEFCVFFYSGTVEEMSGPGPHFFVGKLKPDGRKWLIEYWKTARVDR